MEIRPPYLKGLNLLNDKKLNNQNTNNILILTIFTILKKNIFTFFNFINIVIAILLFSVKSYKNLLFLTVILINTFISSFQEIRSILIIHKINKKNKKPIKCIRNDEEIFLSEENVLKYELIVVTSGDRVPFDCEIEHGKLLVDESIITGESDYISKEKGEEVISGSYIIEGFAFLRVLKNFSESRINYVKDKININNNKNSFLIFELNKILKLVSIIILPLSLMMYFILIKTNTFTEAIPKLSASIIGMIPSGLILLTTVALSIGCINLTKKNALINKIEAVENLARVNTICLDKTGTITTGDMTVVEIIPIGGNEQDFIDSQIINFLKYKRDDTSTTLSLKKHFKVDEEINVNYKSIPFNSKKKWSAVIMEDRAIIMGAHQLFTLKDNVIESINNYTNLGLRIIIVAISDIINEDKINIYEAKPICYIVLKDVLRSNIINTIKYFYNQKVNLKVISGDNANTVSKISKIAGIYSHDIFIDCARNSIYDDINFEKINIYGRVSPEDKEFIINKLKINNAVAMVGDGINDIGALTISDCAITMNNAPEIVKAKSHIVLLNNDFSIFPSIINEGRRVINNISLSSSLFLNKTFFSIIMTILCAIFIIPYPIQPIQLTLVSTLTIGLPSLLFTFEKNYSINNKKFINNILINSVPTAIITSFFSLSLIVFYKKTGINPDELSAITTLVIFTCFYASLLKISLPLNLYRMFILIIPIFLIVISLLFFKNFFMFTNISLYHIILLFWVFLVTSILLYTIDYLLKYKGIKNDRI